MQQTESYKLILTDENRLYYKTEDTKKAKGKYKADILLYHDLKVKISKATVI